MAAGQVNDGIGPQGLPQPGAGHVAGLEADGDERHPFPVPFDQRVGGKRGRQGHERDRRGVATGARQNRVHGVRNAVGQRLVGRQRFRLGDQLRSTVASAA